MHPLDDLLTGATLRVLRVLWGEMMVCWPVEIARRTGLSRTSVHTALDRLAARALVEEIPGWSSRRTFGYRLVRENPLVRELNKLFQIEAKLTFAARVEAGAEVRTAGATAAEGGIAVAARRPADRGPS